MGHAFDFPKVKQLNPLRGVMSRKAHAVQSVATQIRARRARDLKADGLSVAEIAAEMSLSETSVRNLLKRLAA